MNDFFAARADEFEAAVKSANLTGTTEVTLIYRCVDENGNEVLVRTSIVPTTKVGGFGERGASFAEATHRDSILGDINSLVRHAPDGWIMLRDAPQIPLQITGFDMEITDV